MSIYKNNINYSFIYIKYYILFKHFLFNYQNFDTILLLNFNLIIYF